MSILTDITMFDPAENSRYAKLFQPIVERRLLLQPINIEHFFDRLERLKNNQRILKGTNLDITVKSRIRIPLIIIITCRFELFSSCLSSYFRFHFLLYIWRSMSHFRDTLSEKFLQVLKPVLKWPNHRHQNRVLNFLPAVAMKK